MSDAETVVHPAAYYLGLRAISDPVVGRPFSVAVRDFDFEGRAIGGRPVDVLLLRRLPGSTVSGDQPGYTPRLSKPVSRCRVSSAMTETSCSLTVPEPGIYVVHGVSNDELGRKAQAAMTVFAREPSAESVATASVGRVSANRSDATHALGLLLDRSAYHRGDKARLFVHSPFVQARAIVTLEGARVHFGASREVGRTSEFEIPVSDSAGPGVHVSVLLLREPGRTTAQSANSGANEPVLAQSAIPLLLAADEWRLQVDVKPHKSELLPRSSMVCDVTVRDRRGAPQKAELTVWAVEDQAPSRSADEAPDLLRVFARPRELLTSTYDSRAALGWLLSPGPRGLEPQVNDRAATPAASAHPSTGSSAPLLGSARGTATVLFLPEVLTDEQGHARIEFAAPTQLSKFRIFAEAATDKGEFGKGAASFSTGMPLAMRTVMPRFVRVQDHFRAGLVLATQSEVSGEALVSVHAEGIELLESSQRTISLMPDRPREVLFDFKTRTPGTAKIRFNLDANGEHRSVELGIPVLFQQPRETVTLYGETQHARAEQMPRLAQFAEAQTQLDVSLSRTPLVGLAQSIEAVLEQEHDNTEQLASRLLILGALPEFSRNTGARLPADANQQVQRLLAELVRRQVPTGGYAYYRGAQPSRWLSTYVLWVLARTAAAKVPLPPELR
ncbi:MAG TPA: alpha-2-macroglobulin family protein, partial [Polyangiaceae bacterium]|nr:alpha-2-macroglobulin family protein [Polyangiaceae bacterium]